MAEQEPKTYADLISYLEGNKRKSAIYFDTANFTKFKEAFTRFLAQHKPDTMPTWRNNPSTYFAELLITLANNPGAPAAELTEEEKEQIVNEIQAAHREAVQQLNANHGKQVKELTSAKVILVARMQELEANFEASQKETAARVAAIKERAAELASSGLSHAYIANELNKLK